MENVFAKLRQLTTLLFVIRELNAKVRVQWDIMEKNVIISVTVPTTVRAMPTLVIVFVPVDGWEGIAMVCFDIKRIKSIKRH